MQINKPQREETKQTPEWQQEREGVRGREEQEELFVQFDVKDALVGQVIDACLRRCSRLQNPHVHVQFCPECLKKGCCI